MTLSNICKNKCLDSLFFGGGLAQWLALGATDQGVPGSRHGRETHDEAGDYVVPNVLNPRDLVSKPDNMDETVLHS